MQTCIDKLHKALEAKDADIETMRFEHSNEIEALKNQQNS